MVNNLCKLFLCSCGELIGATVLDDTSFAVPRIRLVHMSWCVPVHFVRWPDRLSEEGAELDILTWLKEVHDGVE